MDNPGGETVTVLAHLTAVMDERDTRYQQRYDAQTEALAAAFLAQQTAVSAALLAQEKAVQTALLAADRAVSKAETATEKRIEGLNELRRVVQDVSALQIPRVEAEQRLTALADRLDAGLAATAEQIRILSARLDLSQGRGAGFDSGWKILVAAATLALGLWLAFHR